AAGTATQLPEDILKVTLATRELKSVVSEDLAHFRNVDTLDLSDNRLSSSEILLELGNLNKLRVLLLSCNGISRLYTEYLSKSVGFLYHYRHAPDDYDDSDSDGSIGLVREDLLPCLEELDLSFNDLHGDVLINVMLGFGISDIQYLVVVYSCRESDFNSGTNYRRDFHLTVFTRLIKLNLAHNCVTSVPAPLGESVYDFAFLTELDLSHNDLVQYQQWRPLEYLPRLEILSLAYNRIRRIDFGDNGLDVERSTGTKDGRFRALKRLDLTGNEINDLERLHGNLLLMLTGPTIRTIVLKGHARAFTSYPLLRGD
ncbi:hypothetical protein FOL47_003209, partial [Perkinsus chesapeaki]